ncbi:MAG TPA: hypothetical protein V6C85_15395 [Allocoleopsis sp.]
MKNENTLPYYSVNSVSTTRATTPAKAIAIAPLCSQGGKRLKWWSKFELSQLARQQHQQG